MNWTRKKIAAVVLAGCALLGGVAAVAGMSYDGPSGGAHATAMSYDGHSG